MMFTAGAVPGLADGSITVTCRKWKRPQAKIGGHFHKGDLWFEVDAVTMVPVGRISGADARRAGEADAAAVLHRLGDPPQDAEVYRVAFHRIEAAGPLTDEADLGPDEIAEITRRLAAWTRPPTAARGPGRRWPSSPPSPASCRRRWPRRWAGSASP
jgi:hypothetical protein